MKKEKKELTVAGDESHEYSKYMHNIPKDKEQVFKTGSIRECYFECLS